MIEIIPQSSIDAIEKVILLLNQGKIVCFPTETVYALACDATNKQAVESIYSIKERDRAKPIAILVNNYELAEQYVIIDNKYKKLINKFCPGPLTLVCKISQYGNLAKNISNNDKIGFRIPKHSFCLELLKRFGKPIAATSANISGNKEAIDVKEVVNSLSQLSLIIDGGQSELKVASTVIDISTSKIILLRHGIISLEELNLD